MINILLGIMVFLVSLMWVFWRMKLGIVIFLGGGGGGFLLVIILF